MVGRDALAAVDRSGVQGSRHAAGDDAHDDAHWSRRIRLRPCDPRNDGQRGSARGEMQKLSAGKFHGTQNRCWLIFRVLVCRLHSRCRFKCRISARPAGSSATRLHHVRAYVEGANCSFWPIATGNCGAQSNRSLDAPAQVRRCGFPRELLLQHSAQCFKARARRQAPAPRPCAARGRVLRQYRFGSKHASVKF